MRRIIDLSGLEWRLTGWHPHYWRGTVSAETGMRLDPDVPAVPAKVPGSVQQALRDAGLLPDWNEGLNSDLCGCVPEPPPTPPGGERERHGEGGPPGWGGFDQLDEPVEDQWGYHAVADILLAHSLLATQPQVDAARIGLTGVSWGGYLTCIAAGVDHRFRFAAPVYGCGFLGDNPFWRVVLAGMAEERQQRWLDLWDPSSFLGQAAMPFCWVTGTNDFAFSMDILQKSYRLPPGERTLCLRVEMPHGHGGPGENPEEIRVFADGLLCGGGRLARITGQGLTGGKAWATFEAERPISRAELNFTRAEGFWTDRKFNILPAAIDGNRIEAAVPPLTTAGFLNLFDDRGCVASSEHVEL